jgi:hypothetical protein
VQAERWEGCVETRLRILSWRDLIGQITRGGELPIGEQDEHITTGIEDHDVLIVSPQTDDLSVLLKNIK